MRSVSETPDRIADPEVRERWPAFLQRASFVGLLVFGFGIGMYGINDQTTDLPGPISGLGLVGASSFGAWILARLLSNQREPISWSWAHLAGAAFPIWVLISNPQASLFGVQGNWVLNYIKLSALMFLVGVSLDRSSRHKALLWAVAAGATVSAIVARTGAMVTSEFDTSTRSGGLSGDPNESARLFVIALVVCVLIGATSKRRWLLAVGVLGSAIAFAGIGGTMSRTGLALLVLAAGALGLFGLFARRPWIIGVLGMGLALGLVLLPPGFLKAVPLEMSPSNPPTSGGERLLFWKAALEMWSDEPVKGVGVDIFRERLDEYASPELAEKRRHHGPHNIYLSLLAETGVIGLALFMVIVFVAVRGVIRAARRAKDAELRLVAFAWGLALGVVLLGGLTIHWQDHPIFWLAFGACLSFGPPGRLKHAGEV